MANAATPADDSAQTTERGGRWWFAGCFGVTVVVVLMAILATMILRARQAPPLTRDRFDQAWEQWQSQGPRSYRITTVVEGNQPATYAVEVVEGEVLLATRNGNRLTQVRTMGTWSVPGMFDTIEYDVNAVETATRGLNGSRSRLFLRASFDPQYGYPSYYFRSDSVTGSITKWNVTQFGEWAPPGARSAGEATSNQSTSSAATSN